MSNKITEKYFTHQDFSGQAGEALSKICSRTGFQVEKEIFRGQIYDENKVGSLIYKGFWQGKSAVLKIQGLQPDLDEAEIIEAFNRQNKSKKVRLPKLFESSRWNEADGYGFLILEFIDATNIYNNIFATCEEMRTFGDFYQEYRSKCLNDSFIRQAQDEKNAITFTKDRVNHWLKIAESKKIATDDKKLAVAQFETLLERLPFKIEMALMHGHLRADDIFKISNDEFVIMSNLFWSYRPEYYDATFHLWSKIKELRDLSVGFEQVLEYLNKWKSIYKSLPIIQQDQKFEEKFNLMMAERCLGAIVIDLENQGYEKDREKHIQHLTDLFSKLFEHYYYLLS